MSSTPTVYFIDDSATMREVIKIAFRRENINVVACHDAATAFVEIETNKPDVVITDVIMPDKDGYEVCQYIKQNPKFAGTPVILMSGVVNRSVAEKAFSVKADELIRKPFQPQDLIARVRHLLKPEVPAVAAAASPAAATAALSSIFGAATVPANGAPARRPTSAVAPSQTPVAPPLSRPVLPGQGGEIPAASLAAAFAQPVAASVGAPPLSRPPLAGQGGNTPAVAPAQPISAVAPPLSSPTLARQGGEGAPAAPARAAAPSASGTMDMQKLKFEILRLESLVKKLQSDLEAERQYSRALEEHVKTLQESE